MMMNIVGLTKYLMNKVSQMKCLTMNMKQPAPYIHLPLIFRGTLGLISLFYPLHLTLATVLIPALLIQVQLCTNFTIVLAQIAQLHQLNHTVPCIALRIYLKDSGQFVIKFLKGVIVTSCGCA